MSAEWAMIFVGLFGALVSLALMLWFLWSRLPRRRANETISHVSLEGMRAVGELSVFKVITKEIVTETDYSFGEFGRKYLRWVFSQKKLAMIFEFQIDFRYDLRSPQFKIEAREGGTRIELPPVKAEISVRSLRFYDEQRSKFMPWLLPDLLNGAFGPGFSEADKNRLLEGAAEHAKAHAHELIVQLKEEVETSAKSTLAPIATSFGAQRLSIVFNPSVIEVNSPRTLASLAAAEDALSKNNGTR